MSTTPVRETTVRESTVPTGIERTPPKRERTVGVAERPRTFSVGATFLGWCVASFLTLLLVGIVAGIVAGAAAQVAEGGFTGADIQALGTGGLIGGLIATFVAYLVGGYAAGRIARWNGATHGVVVPLWTLLLGILGTLFGATLGPRYSYLNPFGGVDWGNFAGVTLVGIVLVLVAMFGGAYVGGRLGERGEERWLSEHGARRTYVGGRPL